MGGHMSGSGWVRGSRKSERRNKTKVKEKVSEASGEKKPMEVIIRRGSERESREDEEVISDSIKA